MLLPRRLFLATGLLAAVSPACLHAADNAFQVQGPRQIDGVIQMQNHCYSNTGMPAARFRQVAEELKPQYLEGVAPAAARKVGFRFLASCPGPYQATCEGVYGEKLAMHFKADDDMMRGGQARLFCESFDGRWKQGK